MTNRPTKRKSKMPTAAYFRNMFYFLSLSGAVISGAFTIVSFIRGGRPLAIGFFVATLFFVRSYRHGLPEVDTNPEQREMRL